ncbi:MAG: excinuclease ABC subunit A, partial [Muribaculaceae bacterium]|nr:excinuclease ABC subunit A [Muribaculaceae bacterium]
GGESQRVKLAYFISQEKQPRTMFIFDEPTTGLHFHDISTLLKSLNRLVDAGHTVVIIEHNMDVIKCADWIIDIGPEGGEAGGSLVIAGTPEEVAACEESYTGRYLRAKLETK